MAKNTLRRRFRDLSLSLVFLGASASLFGCRVSKSDVTRWGSTEHGPDKLVAVITHDKYEWPLRVEAGLELLRMRPRNGRRVGINRLVEALAQMSADERSKYLQELLPGLAAGIQQAPPAPTADAASDTSVPFKDGAMAILTYDKAQLLSDENTRKQIIDALISWSLHDFDRRLENTSQMFGMEQLVRAIGAPAVKGFPALITIDSTKYDRIATLVADSGDQATKDATAQKLVELARFTNSDAWKEKARPTVEQANKISKYDPPPAKFQEQLAQYQDEALTRVLAALKKIVARAGVDYCLSLAGDRTQPPKRRLAALAALEGRLDRNNSTDVEKVLAIAGEEDANDEVRDLAFQRVGEMSRDQVIGKLYGLFAAKKWKVRWVAADTVLKMSNTDQIPEFMARLPPGLAPGFAIAEPLKYGDAIDRMAVAGKKPRDAVLPYLNEKGLNIAPRLTALGFFYANGKAADLPLVEPLANDRTPTPKVDDADGKWQCEVPKPDSKETQLRDIKTIGEFVTYCVEPAMKAR
jgi:hypothetical protein